MNISPKRQRGWMQPAFPSLRIGLVSLSGDPQFEKLDNA